MSGFMSNISYQCKKAEGFMIVHCSGWELWVITLFKILKTKIHTFVLKARLDFIYNCANWDADTKTGVQWGTHGTYTNPCSACTQNQHLANPQHCIVRILCIFQIHFFLAASWLMVKMKISEYIIQAYSLLAGSPDPHHLIERWIECSAKSYVK